MASYHRAALYVFFDAIETDLKNKIRQICLDTENVLSEDERAKARRRLDDSLYQDENHEDFDLVDRLDLGDKYDIILRWRARLPAQEAKFFLDKNDLFKANISVRNAIMHGRPLTVEEFSKAFSLIDVLKKAGHYFPELIANVSRSESDPRDFMDNIANIFEQSKGFGVFNNLPNPDYDDTGFFPRPQLETDLQKKIMGRHPVITVLGDGGNGKTALTLQVMYGLVNSNDHDFDAIVWVSAKSSRLTVKEIERIGNAITTSLDLFYEVARVFESDIDSPIERVKLLMSTNKILLVIDNLETVLDKSISEFASDIPGQSKVIFTSRVPLGSDLTVPVGAFTESEGLSYLRALINTYGIESLKKSTNEDLKFFTSRLGNKPLLLKWFALGVSAGVPPHSIVKDPVNAIKFCMENIFDALSNNAKLVTSVLIALPRPASQAVLQHVSEITAANIESAIAELLRFSLVEVVKENKYEVNYQVKPFARSYAVRVLELMGNINTTSVLAKYRSVEGALQSVRGQAQLDRYNLKSYTVRSKSEALTVIRLRSAMSLISTGDYDQAFKIIDDAKISNPNYFEVYRAEAWALFKKGDFTNAKISYETAIEVAGEQSHIYYFYAGFLLRAYNDTASAMQVLDSAYKIDPNSVEVVRELARVSLYEYDFDKTHKLLSNWQRLDVKSSREATKLADLQIQAYTRQLEYLMASSSTPDILKSTTSFEEIIDNFDRDWLDGTLIGHLDDAASILQKIHRSQHDVEILPLLDKICSLTHRRSNGSTIGKLKEKGLQPTYGFLVDLEGGETFVSKHDTDDRVWRLMCEGGMVSYDVVERDDKKRAANVVILKEAAQPTII